MRSIPAFCLMQCCLAVLTCSLILFQIVIASIAPILMEEVIALTNGSCTFWCKSGLRVRLHLVRTMWNVDFHSNLKPFAKFLRRLVDVVTEEDVIRNLALKRTKSTPISFGIVVHSPVKECRWCRKVLFALDSDHTAIRAAERRADFV